MALPSISAQSQTSSGPVNLDGDTSAEAGAAVQFGSVSFGPDPMAGWLPWAVVGVIALTFILKGR